MDRPMLDVRNISKQYSLKKLETHGRLSESIMNVVTGKSFRERNKQYGDFYALQDITFSVEEGELFGIIGRNGAGKSTLLKIISKITQPSAGEIRLRGRVGSLLEVGTGFHHELTGRENVYMNGAILGMTRSEIDRKYDTIIEFSEIGKFIDMPVKRYSSGMYLRLAFSVASQMDTEILLMDEVLAVGDARFQAKCKDRMKELREEGRTILFVSHDMTAMGNLCKRGICLENGHIVHRGEIGSVISGYLQRTKVPSGEVSFGTFDESPGDDQVRIRAVRIVSNNETTEDVHIDRPVEVEIEFENREPGAMLSTSVGLVNKDLVTVLTSDTRTGCTIGYDGWYGKPFPKGVFRSRCTLPANFLNEGRYFFNISVLGNGLVRAKMDMAIGFNVIDTIDRLECPEGWVGVIRPKLEWRTEML